MPDLDDLMAEVRRMRDELMVQIYLGSKEAQEQWVDLEKKWQTFASEAKLRESASEISAAARALGAELKAGYDEIKKALQKPG